MSIALATYRRLCADIIARERLTWARPVNLSDHEYRQLLHELNHPNPMDEERTAIHSNARKTYWSQFTPEQRSAEMKRRRETTRQKRAAAAAKNEPAKRGNGETATTPAPAPPAPPAPGLKSEIRNLKSEITTLRDIEHELRCQLDAVQLTITILELRS